MLDLVKEKFINKAMQIHNNRYDYSKVNYTNMNTKVCIICPEHGEFWQTPKNYLHNHGCPKCGVKKSKDKRLLGKDNFINKANIVHGGKYDYSKINYVNVNTKVCIICPEHGDFWQTPKLHLNGAGCSECFKKRRGKARRDRCGIDFIEKAKQIHGDKYDYSKAKYIDSRTKICIICPQHGEFWQTPAHHLSGEGCPKCGYDLLSNNQVSNKAEFVKKARKIYGDKYDYSKFEYVNSKTKGIIICPQHGEFKMIPNSHLRNEGCPKCSHHISQWESEIYQFLTDNGIKCEESNRSILKNQEIDIYLPDYRIGIECDGLYWHSDNFHDKNYHLHKTVLAHMNGIRLIHIFEDEWIFKKDIVKSMLLNILGKTPIRIYARKCQIKDINKDIVKDFNNANSIQNEIASDVNLGLFYNDDLVMCVSFKKNDTNWEITSLCSKLNTEIIGGISKLLNHFMVKFKTKEMIIFSDRRWSVDNTFEKIGFICKGNLKPNYFYVIGKHREKDNFTLSNQVDCNTSKIYDCGCKVWVRF